MKEEQLKQSLINFLQDCEAVDPGYFKKYNIDIDAIISWLNNTPIKQITKEDELIVDSIISNLTKYQVQMPDFRIEKQLHWLRTLKELLPYLTNLEHTKEDEENSKLFIDAASFFYKPEVFEKLLFWFKGIVIRASCNGN